VKAVVNATTDKCYLNRERAQGYREDDALGGHRSVQRLQGLRRDRLGELARQLPRRHGIGLATARAGNVVGGGDWSEDRLVPDLVRSATSGRSVAIRYPQATRPWQHVLEPLAGYLMLGERLLADPAAFAEPWNFGPDASGELSVAEVIVAFARSGRRCAATSTARRSRTSPGCCISIAQGRERLGWRPVWNAATTFERSRRLVPAPARARRGRQPRRPRTLRRRRTPGRPAVGDRSASPKAA
jgi:CDP-glucose 4,6-dehydratase